VERERDRASEKERERESETERERRERREREERKYRYSIPSSIVLWIVLGTSLLLARQAGQEEEEPAAATERLAEGFCEALTAVEQRERLFLSRTEGTSYCEREAPLSSALLSQGCDD
jgi:hypothetical protein